MMADNAQDRFILHSILPAMAIPDPVTCMGIVFCTTRHLDRYLITPAEHRTALLTLASNCRDAYGHVLDRVGVVLVPEASSNVLISEGIPRVCRDVVALCHITRGTARNCHLGQAATVYHSDYFEALPIRFREDGVLIQRPGLHGYHAGYENLAPTLPAYLLTPRDTAFQLDKRLLEACGKAVRLFLQKRHRRELRQLFRAIAITMHASRILPETETTYHDLGPRIISWVSAFETLVHSGQEQVRFRDVIQFMKRIRWRDERIERGGGRRREISLNHDCYTVKNKLGQTVGRETAACRYYRRLYNLRNDFAHGNVIRPREVEARPNAMRGPRIDEIAPLLFRGCILERLREIGILERTPQTGALTLAQFQASLGESLNASSFDGAFAKVLFGRDKN